VASELFPLMLDAPKISSFVGITLGFIIALGLLHGLEYLVEYLEGKF
jgi:hypothetical protein